MLLHCEILLVWNTINCVRLRRLHENIRFDILCSFAIFFIGFYGRPWVMEQRKELFRRYVMYICSKPGLVKLI